MKTFVAILVLAAVCGAHALVVTKEQQKVYYKYHEECQKDNKISDEVFEATKKGEYPDEPTFKAHLYCISQKTGFQNEKGEFQREAIIKKYTDFYHDKAVVEKIVEKCLQPADTPEQAAYNFKKCSHENAPEKIEYE